MTLMAICCQIILVTLANAQQENFSTEANAGQVIDIFWGKKEKNNIL